MAIYGGGIGNIGNLIIVGSTLSGNSASEGGAIVNAGGYPGGYLAIFDSTITDNMAGRNSGHPFGRWNGGAISNYAKGQTHITGCTISNNQAIRGGASLTIPAPWKSSTARSPATAPRRVVGFITLGRFIAVQSLVGWTIDFSTITNNTSSVFSGGSPAPNNFGGGIYNGALVLMGSTILAGNTGPSYFPPSYGCTNSNLYCYSPDCFSTNVSNGTFLSYRDNLVGVVNRNCNLQDYFWGNTLSFDQLGTFNAPLNPALGLLANNGGPTKTHALLPGSLAIDGAICGGVADCPETDQRGRLRPAGMYFDAGAFEFGASPP